MTVNHDRRSFLWGGLVILGAFLIVPLLPYAFAAKNSPILVPNPGADLWRDARQAFPGTTQVGGGGDRGADPRYGRALAPLSQPALGPVQCLYPGWNTRRGPAVFPGAGPDPDRRRALRAHHAAEYPAGTGSPLVYRSAVYHPRPIGTDPAVRQVGPDPTPGS